MDWRELLLSELDREMATTRRVLERVPMERADFSPHEKSTRLGDLASHVARLAGYGAMVMNTPGVDFATADRSAWAAVPDRDRLLALFDSGAAATRAAIADAPEEKYDHTWTLRMGDKIFFSESRPMTLRVFMMNHLIHHRAQLGVYLRLLDVAVPGTYGPSADEPV